MADESSFLQLLRNQVVAQANLIEALTAHPTLVGAGRERAVMDMLRGQLPRRYEVLSGTILGQGDEGSWQKESRQLDVMVVDTFDYPTLLRNGDIAVVLPQAVRVVIEVKSDLETPPDPDRAAEPAKGGGDDAPEQDAPSRKYKPKETFLDAVKQVSRNRLLFGGMAPVLTILLSHKYPAGNNTLRSWLELVVKARNKLNERLGGLEKDSKEYSSVREDANMLEPSLFPDVILADKGAIAVKNGSRYDFWTAGHDKKSTPGLVTLVSYVIDHLERQDPVLSLLRLDEKHEPLQNIRQEAQKLFRDVMAPEVKPDTANAALEIAAPLPAPDAVGNPASDNVGVSEMGGH